MPKREFYSNTPEEIALLDASAQGDLPTVRQLLAQGLDPNTPDMREDPWNVTPLMHAAGSGHEEVVRELLAAKAKVNLADKSFPGEGGGETALHYAAANGHVGAAKLLLVAKAGIDKLSRFGRTPLTVAVQQQQKDMVQFLLEQGADPDMAGKTDGETPLLAAVDAGSLELVKLLVKYGSDVSASDGGGTTPFMYASESMEIALFLIKAGADLEAAEWDGTTSLMWAVIGENAKLVAEVLKRGVNVNALDNEGQSALDFAIRDKLPEIQALLRQAGAQTGAELRPPKKPARKRAR